MIELLQIKRPIFISYSHLDLRIVYEIARALGMDQNQSGGSMGDVWFRFPNPDLIPSTLRLNNAPWLITQPYMDRPWQFDIGSAIITHSESLLVVLTKHSASSTQVQKEFELYPIHKPIWIMSLSGERIPPKWRQRSNIHMCSLSQAMDLNSLLKTVMDEISEAEKDGRPKDEYLLYREAINVLQVFRPKDVVKMAHLFSATGIKEIELGLGRSAIQSLENALKLTDDFPRQELWDDLIKNDTGKGSLEVFGLTPPSAMRAFVLRNLGIAHMMARDEMTISVQERKRYLEQARKCWQESLTILEQDAQLLRRLSNYPYDDIKEACEACLQKSATEI